MRRTAAAAGAAPAAVAGAVLAAVVAFLALAALTAPPAPARSGARHGPLASRCANADTVAGALSRQTMRDAVVCLINQQRTSRHLPALHANALLDHSAQSWTNVMVSTGAFTHGANFSARLTAAGYIWSSAAENIATGFQTPRAVVTAWMASPGHCRNILDPTYAEVGTGVNSHRLGQFAPSTWTQDFGLRMGHAFPSSNYGPQRGCPYRS